MVLKINLKLIRSICCLILTSTYCQIHSGSYSCSCSDFYSYSWRHSD